MISKTSKAPDSHRLLLNVRDKINLKRIDKHVALSNLSVSYARKNIKMSYKNNKFKISAKTWNEEFKLPDESYSVSDIQGYFEYIIKKHRTFTDNQPIKRYVNQTENRITFNKDRILSQTFTPETMKLLGSTKSKINKDKNGENLYRLEITEVVLVHCNIVNNDYQQDSRVLFTFVPNKSFGELLDISPRNVIILKAFNSEFSYNDKRFTDQNSEPLEIERLSIKIGKTEQDTKFLRNF